MYSSVKRYVPNKQCALNYHVRLTYLFLNGSDHAECTQEKADLQKSKVNATKITKVCADRNKLRTFTQL